jgi:NitT/TauT family transport system substrate-binding protein
MSVRTTGRLASIAAAVFTAAAVTLASPAVANEDYGKPGGPVKLVVGYQPYYAQAWSAVAMRGKEMWKKHLPPGSQVEFQIGLQGAVIVNQMLAGKQYIGYMGDMPAIVATTKQDVADVRIVANLGLGKDNCNIFLTRTDAPQFKDAKEAIKWLDGKQVAVPKGSCTDRFAQTVFRKENVKPAAYLNQNIEVITSNFKAGKLDAAVVWEPTASKLVDEGLARRVASGVSVDEIDGAFMTMRNDLIQARPDIVKAWLQAELDAQLFAADPKNAQELAKMAVAQTTGFSEKVLFRAYYGQAPAAAGGSEIRNSLEYTLTPAAMELINRATAFLHSNKSINVDKLRPEAVMPQFTQEILNERKLTAPIGQVRAMPDPK